MASPQWTKPDLVDAGAHVLGARRRWLGPLVTFVLGAYLRPPLDAPRELAVMIGGSDALVEAIAKAARQRKPIVIAKYVLAPSVARDRRQTGVPAINTLGELAQRLQLGAGELEWFADPKHWNRTGAHKLQHYRYEWRTRPGRLPRLLEIPAPRLRAIQRTVLHELLYPIELHDAAHGFVPGRSAVTGAAHHTDKDVVLTVDLQTFFAKVTAGQVFGTLRQAGYSEAVAHRLTGILTHVVPPQVLAHMPPGGNPAQRFALRKALSLPHLPQGAPTSPTVANLSLRRLDSRLAGLAATFDGGYTRYADDLAFSGGREFARRTQAFLRAATEIIEDQGHSVNQLKTRVRRASTRQTVTSVVVNERTNVSRPDFDRLKAILHNCLKHGPESQNREDRSDFRAHLQGHISWVSALHPARGAKLLEVFHRINF
ncbi:reverse transcriptase family protein [Arthrobacter sp. Sr24]